MKAKHLLLAAACVLALASCKKEPTGGSKDPQGTSFKLSEVVNGASAFYDSWEAAKTIPATVAVAGKDLSISEFLCAEANALIAVSESKTDDIAVVSYKAATNPERDSYDKDEIAVVGGPKDGQGVAEDLVTVASRILATAKEKGQIPNQTLIYRGSDALAFSTNRAIITIARALNEYVAAGKFSEKVSAEYIGAGSGTSLYDFAQGFVKYLDVWEQNIAPTLSSCGQYSSLNGTALERVHFIPIPIPAAAEEAGYAGIDQYAFKDYYTVTVGENVYTADQCWEIAIRGLFDICTSEGNGFLLSMKNKNDEYTLANGKSLYAAPINAPSVKWGGYPWYEDKDNGPITQNGVPITEIDLNFFLRCASWHLIYSLNSNGGDIANFLSATSEYAKANNYGGIICPMRELLVAARFYKVLLDGGVTKNAYDALKDVKVDFDLYNQQLPVFVKTDALSFDAENAEAKTIELTATESWTAEPTESWITVNPASGSTGDCTITVTVADNKSTDARKGSVKISAGDYSKNVTISQAAYVPPAEATIMDFARGFITCLDKWNATVGTVDADSDHNGDTAYKNVHLIPIPAHEDSFYKDNKGNQYDADLYSPFWTASVCGKEYTLSQCYEISVRSLMELCTTEGNEIMKNDVFTNKNHAFTLGKGKAMSATMPMYTSGNSWGGAPWLWNFKPTYKGAAMEGANIDFLLRRNAWLLMYSLRANNNAIANVVGLSGYTDLGSSDYDGELNAMSLTLCNARIFKYIVDNNITENVYDAIKDAKFSLELYDAE